ncbi:hypothetical protein EMIHUDRAFT_197105 [Emiliania huxleyi CCMP1516]|uniref:Glycosyl transferase CAP10 domain-containing protein n=2 Tax=Emiliania huxleyi TaxID=2903 RepID=A0A0D3ITP8_EMIH1|nr:hypothetical protein EMIHUDRAFT_197105 [Emiliania huxleyi CCMP1516]EOD14633.1 hypothetical protein EMIHUDRAFT_197105 [Emiliania huxleyi CCMP1516]|eukprot:XP_005767062.1 hypothetical protein EMIHUDRAFT_197105 [Emiliania huxleyi CCMP1516]
MSGSSLGLLALAAAMLDHLRLANTVLQQRLHGYEQLHAKMEAKLASCTSTTSPLSAAAAAGAQPADAKALLAAHAHWDWRSVARDLLQPWPSVTQENLASAALPNLDVVVAANDEPRARAEPGDLRAWRRTCRRWGANAAPPAIFSSTVNAATMDLPWLDFAWPHKLRTPPWSDKLEIAMHTGNVGSGWRKALAAVAERAPREEMKLHATGGYQKHKCFMRFEDQCGYKYLLNSASIGYANKFKSLLLCGSVVLYVREGMRHKEFYEYGLLPGVHYHAVDTAAEVPAAVKWLRANDEYARAVAEAGRARMASLDEAAVTGFMAELLTQYSKRQSFRVAPQPGAAQPHACDFAQPFSTAESWEPDGAWPKPHPRARREWT